MAHALKLYRGSDNIYVDIADRGPEHLGVGLQFATHKNGTACLFVRFVAHSDTGEFTPFTHLTKRFKGEFLDLPDGKMPIKQNGKLDLSKRFYGVRLNKVVFPVFAPAPPGYMLIPLADKNELWMHVALWLADQVTQEGFQLSVPSLVDVVREMLAGPPFDPNTVELVLEFPDLKEEAKALAKAKEMEAAAMKTDALEDEEDDDDEKSGYTIN